MYPLTHPQKRIWYTDQLFAHAGLSHLAGFIRIKGNVDYPLLAHVIRIVTESNSAFHLRLADNDEQEPTQYFKTGEAETAEIPMLDICDFVDEEHLDEWVRQEAQRPFDLFDAPLYKFSLIRLNDDEGLVFGRFHHVMVDGMSLDFFSKQVIDTYTRLRDGEPYVPANAAYTDFIKNEQQYIASSRFEKDSAYWHEKFADLPAFTSFKDYNLYETGTEAQRTSIAISKSFGKALHAFCSAYHTNAFSVFLAALYVYVYKMTGQRDIVVGTAYMNRTAREEKETLGMFVSTLPLRTLIEPEADFVAYLQQVNKEKASVLRHQKFPYNLLIQHLRKTNPDLSRLFGISLEYRPLRWDEIKEIAYQTENVPHGHEPNDINIHLVEEANTGDFSLYLDYRTALYSEDEMQHLMSGLLFIIGQAIAQPALPLAAIDLVGEAEKDKLLRTFNDTAAEYPRDQTLVSLLEAQAKRTPDRTALVWEDRSLTYREMNARANRLARRLIARGVQRDQRVGVIAERSFDLVVALLAVLKAGGAYVPIDPAYPAERIRYMLEDSGAGLLLVQSGLAADIPFAGERIEVDVLFADMAAGHRAASVESSAFEDDPSNPAPIAAPGDLAYIIYTSGTTGQPKGVMIEHRNVVRLLFNDRPLFDFKKTDVWTLFHSYCFDFSVWEMYGALLYGGTLVIVPKPVAQDPEAFLALLERERVTVLNQTPSAFYALIQAETDGPAKNLALRQVIFGGEALTPTRLKPWQAKYPAVQFVNMYGITETTVHVTYKAIGPAQLGDPASNIGRPIPTLRCFVLDEHRRLVPIGVQGELYVSGEGVARGYLNRPELTAERFVDNPFAPGERMYRTGDLARWLPGGDMEYGGRIDHQVKIRGHRIETGEIEARLLQNAQVQDAAVVAGTDRFGQSFLCAYVVLKEGGEVSAVREQLVSELPAYMIPAYFMPLASLPLTSNGKLNRKALPEPDGDNRSSAAYAAPRTAAEVALAGVWQDTLGVSRVGLHDNFFQLGGDSIKALQVCSRMRKLGYDLSVKDLLRHGAIGALAPSVRESRTLADQGPVEGETGLTPIQLALFKEQAGAGLRHYNQAVMLYRQSGFDEVAVRRAFERLTAHHDALRLVFSAQGQNSGVTASIRGLDGDRFVLRIVDFTAVTAAEEFVARMTEAERDIQAGMEPERGPLVRLGLFHTAVGDHLLIAIHHLAVDGVSWRILLEDFAELYAQALAGNDAELPPKSASFPVYAEQLRAYASGRKLQRELDYWRALETKAATIGPLPKDGQAAVQTRAGERYVSASLTPEETERLLKQTHHAYGTEMNDLLLTALGLAVNGWTGREQVLIQLEGHGREPIGGELDVTRTVGWFTSVYPVLLDLRAPLERAEPLLGYRIRRVKDGLRRIPAKGVGYGIAKHLMPGEFKQEVEFQTVPELSFNYLGQFDADVRRDVFELSPIACRHMVGPDARRTASLDINAMIVGGQLTFTLGYHGEEYAEATAERLIRDTAEQLRAIIAHCAAQTETVRTAGDFSGGALTFEEWDALAQRIYAYADPANIADAYPLSYMQEGMLSHALKTGGTTAYFEQAVFVTVGALNPALFEQSVNLLIDRYDALRTSFVHEGLLRPHQLVWKRRNMELPTVDLSGLDAPAQESYIKTYQSQDREQGFELEKEPLLRVAIFRTGPTSHTLIWSFHHIIMDGWCLGIVLKEVFEQYHALAQGRELRLELAPAYGAYIQWLHGNDREESLSYWRSRLADYREQATLPKLGQRGEAGLYRHEELTTQLDPTLTEGLQQLAQTSGATLNTVLQAIWALLLQRYNRTDDVVFGSVVSGRPAELAGAERMVGLFINTVPVRVRLEKEPFRSLVHRLQQEATESEPHSYCPLVEIQAASALREHLLDHLLVFENYPIEEGLRALSGGEGRLRVQDIAFSEHNSYDFTVTVVPGPSLKVVFSYNAHVYDCVTVERIAGHLAAAAAFVTAHPECLPGEVELLSPQERAKLTAPNPLQFADYPREQTIHGLFEAHAARRPEAPALAFGDVEWSYRTLNERANRLARALRAKGVRPDQLVGVLLERSADMIVSLLAVLKAGGAYVPIDPDYPQARIGFILEDSGCELLLTHSGLSDRFIFAGEQVWIDDPIWFQGAESDLEPVSGPSDLAYVIYTSGTTGTPKGVLIDHHNVVRLLHNERTLFDFGENDVWTLFHSYSFDFSVWEMYGALLHGGKLVIVPKETARDPRQFAELLREQRVTVLNQTPTAFYPLIQEEQRRADRGLSLRMVIFGGEALAPVQLEPFRAQYGETRLINMYGITETTVHVTYKEIFSDDIARNSMGIGTAIPTLSVYVLDAFGRPAPIGVPGELYVGGEGVARGYLGRPELTAERFVPHPDDPKERLYKSGDLVRLLPDGSLDYLGRIDDQVKIRGHRIELGEIERELLQHPAIRESAVIAREDEQGHRSLCAYYTADEEIAATALRAYLAGPLPGYMLPAHFVRIDRIPLTGNGKVDRKALPKPEGRASGQPYEAPRNPLEAQLAELWREALDGAELGVHDHFFDAGGDSIKVIGLIHRINGLFPNPVQIRDLYLYPTVRELAEYMESRKDAEEQAQGLRQAEAEAAAYRERLFADAHFSAKLQDAEDAHPMSEIAKGMIFHSLQAPEAGVYHDQIVYRLRDDSYDHNIMREVLAYLIEKHSILRSSFHINGFPEPTQVVHRQAAVPVHYDALAGQTRTEREAFIRTKLAEDRQKPFAVDTQQPMWRLHIYGLDEQFVCLAWIFHHAMMDGWSVASLMAEATKLYEARKAGGTLEPQPLKNSYRAFVVEQAAIRSHAGIREFWREELGDYKRWELPHPAGGDGTVLHSVITRHIPTELMTRLHTVAQEMGTSFKTVGFSAFLAMLRLYSFEDDVVAGLVENSRPVCEDGDSMLGCFLNTVPFRAVFEPGLTWADLIGQVHRKHVDLKWYGRLPLTEIAKAAAETAYGQNPFFDAMFNYIDFHVFNDVTQMDVSDVLFEVHNSYERTNMLLDFSLSTTLGHNLIKIGSVLPEDTISELADAYLRILAQMTAGLQTPINKVDLLAPAQRALLLSSGQAERVTLRDREPIHRLLERLADAAPQRVALTYRGQTLTVAEVNRRANRLARLLQEKGLRPGMRAGIAAERSFDLVIGVLAVLKAGGAYVPIDPEFPAERIAYLLEDSEAAVLLTSDASASRLSFAGTRVKFDEANAFGASDANLAIPTAISDAAYVMYTSGSTGKPKGVLVEHAQLMQFLYAHEHLYPLAAGDAFLLKTNYTFDVSLTELFGWIIGQGRLAIAEPGAEKEPQLLMEAIRREGVTHINFVPSMLSGFVWNAALSEAIGRLKYIFAAGEALPPELAGRIREALPNVRLVNAYGPTEATVYAASYTVRGSEGPSVPIGRPFPNAQAYIVSRSGELQPPGIPGELWIGGAGVARGYWNRSALTDNVFVDNAFTGDGRIYKTGDLVRWLPDGHIEYRGRIDHQVKIRGYRIELGEIESALLRLPAVHEAAVLARLSSFGQYELCAYLAADKPLTVSGLRDGLARTLPSYMLPSSFIQLDRLPLTASGKLDRKALPLTGESLPAGSVYEAPSTEAEALLAAVWQDVLGVARVGVNDHFFELGGDSIKALQLSARLHEQGYSLAVADLFRHPTIAALAPLTAALRLQAEQGPVQGEVALTPAQRRRLETEGGRCRSGQAVTLRRRGGFDETIVREVFDRLAEHHDALRMSFCRKQGHWMQHNEAIGAAIVYTLEIVHPHGEAEQAYGCAEQIGQWLDTIRCGLDAEQGPLIRMGLLRGEGEDTLTIAIHPLITDGKSWRILLDDFTAGYEQRLAGEAIGFPAKTVSYQAYTAELDVYARHTPLQGEQAYWRAMEDVVSAVGRSEDAGALAASVSARLEAAAGSGLEPASLEAETAGHRQTGPGAGTLDLEPTGSKPIASDYEPAEPETAAFGSKRALQEAAAAVESRAAYRAQVVWSAEETALLLVGAHETYSTTPVDLLLAALGLAAQHRTGDMRTAVSVEGTGREAELPGALDMTRTVGSFSSAYPVVLDLSTPPGAEGEAALGHRIKAVKDALRRTPNGGIGYELLRNSLTEASGRQPADHRPTYALRYFGELDTDQSRAAFELAEFAPDTILFNSDETKDTVEVIVYAAQGVLAAHFYSRSFTFDESGLTAYALEFKRVLQAVLTHCAAHEHERTLTDFSDDELTMDELNDIAGFISIL